MTWYDSNFKQRKPVAIDASGTGTGTVISRDVEFLIPKDWDLFWDNIRSDMFDVIVTNAIGEAIQYQRKTGANYSTRTLSLQVNDVTIKSLNINIVYVYFENPNQTTDPTTEFSPETLLNGYIELSRPSALLVSQPLQRPPTTEPQTAFVKSSTDEIDVFFSTAGLFNIRANPYNDRLGLEGIYYVNAQSLDSSGTNDTTRYDVTKTRFIDGFIRIRAKGGTSGTDYALVCRLVTTNNQQIDIRCLIQVRDQLPS